MSSHLDMPSMPKLGATSANILSKPMSKGSVSFGSLYSHIQAWRRVVQRLTRQTQIESTTTIVIISSKSTTAEMPAILMNKNLSAEDRGSRDKGLQLVARFENLVQTDEGFRRWLQVGFDQIASGQVVIFGDSGWKEK